MIPLRLNYLHTDATLNTWRLDSGGGGEGGCFIFWINIPPFLAALLRNNTHPHKTTSTSTHTAKLVVRCDFHLVRSIVNLSEKGRMGAIKMTELTLIHWWAGGKGA